MRNRRSFQSLRNCRSFQSVRNRRSFQSLRNCRSFQSVRNRRSFQSLRNFFHCRSPCILVSIFLYFSDGFNFGKIGNISILIYKRIIIKNIIRIFAEMHHSSFANLCSIFFVCRVFLVLFSAARHIFVKSLIPFNRFSHFQSPFLKIYSQNTAALCQ